MYTLPSNKLPNLLLGSVDVLQKYYFKCQNCIHFALLSACQNQHQYLSTATELYMLAMILSLCDSPSNELCLLWMSSATTICTCRK